MQSAQQTNVLRDAAIAIVTERIEFDHDASEYRDDIAACIDRALDRGAGASGSAHNVAMSALDEMDAIVGGYHAQWTADGGAS